MMHEVEIVNGQQCIAYANGVRPWHGLGTEVRDCNDSMEVLEKSGLANWQIEKWPTRCTMPEDSRIRSFPEDIVRAHEIMGAPEQYQIVRTGPTPEHIRILTSKSVKKGYTIIQHEQIFDVLDHFVKAGEMSFECAGSLREGSRVFILMRFTDKEMNEEGVSISSAEGDTIAPFLLCNVAHNGEGAFVADLTKVQVVCMNTLTAAENDQQHAIYIPHTISASERLEKAVAGLSAIRDQWKSEVELFQNMGKMPITTQECEQLSLTILDIPLDASWDRVSPQAKRRVNRIDTLFRTAPGRQGSTLWDYFSAWTYYLTHDRKIRKGGDKLESQWFGHSLMIEKTVLTVCKEFMQKGLVISEKSE